MFRLGASGRLRRRGVDNEKQVTARSRPTARPKRWKIELQRVGRVLAARSSCSTKERPSRRSHGLSRPTLSSVKSLTPHWSVGAVGALRTSIFSNYDLRTRLGAGVEYNVFPYSESTRRLLDAALHGRHESARTTRKPRSTARTRRTCSTIGSKRRSSLRQPWGGASASFEVAQYLSQPDKYRLSSVRRPRRAPLQGVLGRVLRRGVAPPRSAVASPRRRHQRGDPGAAARTGDRLPVPSSASASATRSARSSTTSSIRGSGTPADSEAALRGSGLQALGFRLSASGSRLQGRGPHQRSRRE